MKSQLDHSANEMVTNYNYTAQKTIDKIMSDLFVSRCQKCSIGKLIFYAACEYKTLHRQFFDGNTLQNLFFFNKELVFFFLFFFFVFFFFCFFFS